MLLNGESDSSSGRRPPLTRVSKMTGVGCAKGGQVEIVRVSGLGYKGMAEMLEGVVFAGCCMHAACYHTDRGNNLQGRQL